MKIKQFAVVIISICGLSAGIAKQVRAVEPPIPKFQPLVQYKLADKDKGGNTGKDRGGNTGKDSTDIGGSRGVRGGSCSEKEKPFLVLIPTEQDTVDSLASHPTFWLYIPPSSSIQFVLNDEIEQKKIYETKFNVESERGFISWKLPSSAPPLEIDSSYRWEFTLDCGDDESVLVQGLILRIAASDSLISQLKSAETLIEKIDIYQENNLWHESITELLNLRRNNPNDPEIKHRFKSLLGNKWYDALINAPIQDCC
ncbi:DUF928 domain-containing protein [Dapis sp. BLCC M126]|uniref:DUF928 domain-containing protein n=1 Tax=Dapis sp. BLCC M126 TaxID=3400189 RepID=UPI003CEE7245